MTALEALGDIRLRQQVQAATGASMNTIMAALKGVPTRCMRIRSNVIASLSGHGVDISTIPQRPRLKVLKSEGG